MDEKNTQSIPEIFEVFMDYSLMFLFKIPLLSCLEKDLILQMDKVLA